MSHTTANVVIVALDGDQMGVVREALAAEAVLPNAAIGYEDAIDAVLRTLPEVVLVGFDNDPDAAAALARELKAERVRSTLIAIGHGQDKDVILRAMRSGFQDHIALPAEADQLRAAVIGAAQDLSAEEGSGAVIAFCGAKGGVGATFLATHLAAELAGIHRVVCLDLDLSMGDVAATMDIVPKDDLSDLMARGTLDERALTGAVYVHPSKVHFLCVPNDIDRIPQLGPDQAVALLSAAATGYQYVIADCGTTLDETSLTVMNAADQIFLVATPDVVSVRDAHRKYNALTTAGIEGSRIRLILNKMTPKPALTKDTIEATLEVDVAATVAYDPIKVDQAINAGKLLREVAPRADTVVDIGRLVGLLGDDEEGERADVGAAKPKGLLARMFGR